MMSISGIQGQLLEVTVVGCNKLKDKEWFSRQDPYVIVEYGSTKNRTRTCTDGGKNPIFQEKFVFTLIEGLREINVVVWNSNTVTLDDFIGSGKVQLQKVLSQGYDDSSWTIQSKTGRYAGEVRLIMHYANANKPAASYPPSAPPYGAPQVSQAPTHYAHPPHPAPAPLTAPSYPSTASPAAFSAATYPPASAHYPSPSPYPSFPSTSTTYPPSAYPPTPTAYPPSACPPTPTAYPPSAYPPTQPSAYPPSTYPPPTYPPASMYSSAPYPPPPHLQSSPYPPSGSYSGLYPPPPY